jgi:hypothetical protein
MRYVDGFLLPLPKQSLQPHRKLLGGGRRLFDHVDPSATELERTRVIESPRVTHLKYRNVK